MHNPFVVRLLQCFGNLLRNGQSFFDRNSAALHPVRQRFSRNQLHHQKVAAVAFLQSVDRGDA